MPRSTRRLTSHRNVHVSLPADVYERVAAKSDLAGAPFSTTLAEILREALDREDRARLEEALRSDGQTNAGFAREAGVAASRVWTGGSMTDPSNL